MQTKLLAFTSSRNASFPKYPFYNLLLIYEILSCVSSHLVSRLGHWVKKRSDFTLLNASSVCDALFGLCWQLPSICRKFWLHSESFRHTAAELAREKYEHYSVEYRQEWVECLNPSSRIIQTPCLQFTKTHGPLTAGTSQILNIQSVRMWADFIRFKIGSSGDLLWMRCEKGLRFCHRWLWRKLSSGVWRSSIW
jgi:hypothetical protein